MRTQNLVTKTLPYEKGYLTIISEVGRKTYEIKDFNTIGRDINAHISMPDNFMSGRHARVEKRVGGFYIRDLNSRNGTFVNGCRVMEAKLQEHDRVCIGMTEFIFSSEQMLSGEQTVTVSQNPAWELQLKRIPAIAQSPHPVLIAGPSGTGKELIANVIHQFSTRSLGPYLSINCSALTENLAESELFGHIKGSFTGAQTDRKGAFEAARGGTLFLDEIGDMPMNLQPKFLRALENNEIKPVGSDKPTITDVRIVAATNKDLKKLVEQGKFREDLYFRLHIMQIQPPALRDRMEDFDMLIKFFSRPLRVNFTIDALVKLKSYDWPGNIRELKNVISRAAALYPAKPISLIELDTLLDKPTATHIDDQHDEPKHRMARRMFSEFEKEAIIDRLIYYHGNQRRAAEELGIAKSTLHDRIKKYRIDVSKLRQIAYEKYSDDMKNEMKKITAKVSSTA